MLEKLKDENCSKRTEVFEEFMKDDHSISELAYKYDGGEQHLKAKNKRRWFFELLFPVCEDVNIRDNEDLEKVFNVNVRLFKYAQASVFEDLNFLQKYCKKADLLRYIPEKVCKKKLFLENVLWQMIKEAPEVIEYMPSDLVADEAIVTDGCRHNPDIFKYVNISLKNDFALVKKLSGISPKIVDYLSNEVKCGYTQKPYFQMPFHRKPKLSYYFVEGKQRRYCL
ncbi:hypothetical protein C9374_010558 [Naegleria lovaniensis]|uniref:Uncharacterized protein n=1 Tax=Naegleria lovaniensis TaxID=51637 RepID=A0AA88GGF0_NAELO|nr:uncharacterized protein C9374_010558 [Naegleria lovaniensis]KAG2374814.1 hypothetical protein C9374_010558 [Naegleria lovaniensis]